MKILSATFTLLVWAVVACSSVVEKTNTTATVSARWPIAEPPTADASLVATSPPADNAFPTVTPGKLTETATALATCTPTPHVTPTGVRASTKQIDAQWITGVFFSEGRVGLECLQYYRLFHFFEGGKVISTLVGTNDLSRDWPTIHRWFYAGNTVTYRGWPSLWIAETFVGEYRLDEGDVHIEIWQRNLDIFEREYVSAGDHWYDTYEGGYWGDKLLFDYYDREGLVAEGEEQTRSVYEYEYTRLSAANE